MLLTKNIHSIQFSKIVCVFATSEINTAFSIALKTLRLRGWEPEEDRLPTNSAEKPSLTKEAILRLAQCIWAYLYTQIYLLARVRKVFEQLFIHWSIRSYQKRGFCTVTYTFTLEHIHRLIYGSVDVHMCVCVYFQMSTRCVAQKYIYKIHRKCNVQQPTNQLFVLVRKHSALDQTKDDHCLFK